MPSIFRMTLASPLKTILSPARRRVSLEGLFSRLWRRFACWRRSLPLPVSLKRFLAPLWVFIFGMGTDLLTYPQKSLQLFRAATPAGGVLVACCRTLLSGSRELVGLLGARLGGCPGGGRPCGGRRR